MGEVDIKLASIDEQWITQDCPCLESTDATKQTALHLLVHLNLYFPLNYGSKL